MKVGICQEDGKLANLALMKIANYYSKVEWFNPMFDYDMVYSSKIFNFTYSNPYLPEQTIRGGTGYDTAMSLPDDIEECQPDYSIYPNIDYSLQRYSTGCIRKCSFCVVPKKEGGIKPQEPMDLNTNGKYIYLLDNNFFASPEWESSIKHLLSCKQPVQFEGIDVRLLDEEMLYYLGQVKQKSQYHIAWDNPKQNLTKRLEMITKTIKPYKWMCYVLIGFDSTREQDLFRVMKLKELGIDPFVMPYNKKDNYQKRFARWVNHKAIFKSVEWKHYK